MRSFVGVGQGGETKWGQTIRRSKSHQSSGHVCSFGTTVRDQIPTAAGQKSLKPVVSSSSRAAYARLERENAGLRQDSGGIHRFCWVFFSDLVHLTKKRYLTSTGPACSQVCFFVSLNNTSRFKIICVAPSNNDCKQSHDFWKGACGPTERCGGQFSSSTARQGSAVFLGVGWAA